MAVWHAATALAIYGLNIIAGVVVALVFVDPAILLGLTIVFALVCWAALAYVWQSGSRRGMPPVARYTYLFAAGLIGLDVLIAIASY
ncbi:hypothetical protein [Croceicoccus naphthovorans]|uniref:Uncharacterized protein n=1 Tax=Croceicoccus naphthovorans TaxID=1348774 RepID=A0A0G3XE29_9SPHN|nr:hypothetical protein [Croceicoccus naphthovorans]AKM09800.1 hypothetical protein AB433_07105 [Croceicoccus naphthovorans]MBB3990639.1 hypothetical protein [Croceicoccus naphthovorans]